MSHVRLTVTRAEDETSVINALQRSGIVYFPRTSDSNPETVMEVEGRQYIGNRQILHAISRELTDLHDLGRGRRCERCPEPARWLFSHQFAGDHYFCSAHGEQQSDEDEDNSHYVWHELSPVPA